MPRQMTVLSVFVASPSDVEEERNRLEGVVRELNLAWASRGIQIELVKWETHSYPSVGTDAQSVVNEQIPDDYDIFMGIMWGKAGTRTKTCESGTIEEFCRAKNRHDTDPSSVQIMFYFKDAPLAPSLIDLRQMQTIQDFREGLGDEGVFHWKFNTVDEFSRFVRLHLTRHVEEWRNRNDKRVPPANRSTPVPEPSSRVAVDDKEEPGLLDLEEEIQDELSELSEVTEQIGEATADVGKMMRERTAELERINQLPNVKTVGRKMLRHSLGKAAADMDKYTARVDGLLPLFTDHLEGGISAFTKAIPILAGFSGGNDGEENRKRQLKDTVKTLRESMTDAADNLEEYKSTVSSLPSITTVMNRSRRATASVIQRLIDAIRSAQLQLAEVENLIESSP